MTQEGGEPTAGVARLLDDEKDGVGRESGRLETTPSTTPASRGRRRTGYVESIRVVLVICLVLYHNHRIFEKPRNYNQIVISRPPKAELVDARASSLEDLPPPEDGIDLLLDLVGKQQLAILQAGLNLYFCISGIAFHLSFRSKRSALSVLLERTKKLVLVFTAACGLLAVPTNFFLQQCRDPRWDLEFLAELPRFYLSISSWYPSHLAFLPYLFVITIFFWPSLQFLHLTNDGDTERGAPTPLTMESAARARRKLMVIIIFLMTGAVLAFGLIAPVLALIVLYPCYQLLGRYLRGKGIRFRLFVPRNDSSGIDPEDQASTFSRSGEHSASDSVKCISADEFQDEILQRITRLDWWTIVLGSATLPFGLLLNALFGSMLLPGCLFIMLGMPLILSFIPQSIGWTKRDNNQTSENRVGDSVPVQEGRGTSEPLLVGINFALLGMIVTGAAQVAMLCFGEDLLSHHHNREINMPWLGMMGDRAGWWVASASVWRFAQMVQTHSSFFLVGFFWSLFEERLPPRLPRNNLCSILVSLFSVLVAPFMVMERYPDFVALTPGYYSFKGPTHRFLSACGSWFWIYLCVRWNKWNGNQDFEEGTFLTFIKNSYFLVFMVHPLWESIFGCYLKHIDFYLLSWWAKYFILHSSVYFLSFLWSYAVLKSRAAVLLGLAPRRRETVIK